MKALTLTEPWATLVAIGAKRIETRGWSTDYRGPLAIHAARRMTGEDLEFAFCDRQARYSLDIHGRGWPHGSPRPMVKDAFAATRGRVLAVARLVACVPTRDALRTGRLWSPYDGEWPLTRMERGFGDFAEGRFAWILADVGRLPDPVPAKGGLGLWEWWDVPADVWSLVGEPRTEVSEP